MARKSDMFGVSGTDTIIGSSVRLKGNLSSESDITIDGRLVGNIKSGGHVTVGMNAHIGGDITATSASISGKVEGNIKVLDSLSIAETGQVHGDTTTTRIEIAMGGILIGASNMKPATATEPDRPDAEPTK